VELEQVVWVPSWSPPHKQKTEIFKHRLEMVQRAITDHPAFTISIEAANRQPSYPNETLIDIQVVYPNTHGYWIVGLDAFQTLPRWYRRQELAAECDWLVAPRIVSATPAGNIDQIQLCEQVAQKLAAESINIRWQMLQMPWVGLSSSLIRQYCRAGSSIRYLVPEAVRQYIATHHLYSQRSLPQGVTASD
jgi:nicotinate-nucleotide adenylyltransferase